MLFTFKSEAGYTSINLDNILSASYSKDYKMVYIVLNQEYNQLKNNYTKNNKIASVSKERTLLEAYITHPEDIKRFFAKTDCGSDFDISGLDVKVEAPRQIPVDTEDDGA